MTIYKNKSNRYIHAIQKSGLTIYDHIEIDDPKLWIPTIKLEKLIDSAIKGISLADLPLRTRSKVVKEHVCRALGYPVPATFKRTQPRFSGQCFDIYVQKSNNLQIWNEEVAFMRRYVIVRIGKDDIITKVRVISGKTLAQLDKTGTLTKKYQVRIVPGEPKAELVSALDTDVLRPLVRSETYPDSGTAPISPPGQGQLLSIRKLHERLRILVGQSFPEVGHDQERNRGTVLQRLVCRCLGYADYRDDGQFPDVPNQLLEVKLQTAPTIDLGLVSPDSEEILIVPKAGGCQIRHCDVRYALFYATTDGKHVTITHLFLTTGEDFFMNFPKFQGNITNAKIQIPLPIDFFES